MKNIMKEKNQLLYIFLLAQPFLDLITSLMTRFNLGPISLGVVVRGVFILIMLIYLFFYSKTKYKKLSIASVFLLGFYSIFYFLTKPELITNKSFLLTEIISLFKYLYFPILFLTLLNYCEQYKPDKDKIVKIFVINLMVFSFFIIVPHLTHTSFNSYAKNRGTGIVGWFFAANDIGLVMVTLFSLIHIIIDGQYDFKKFLLYIPVIFSICLIGTKSAYFGMVASLGLLMFYYLINIKKKYKHFITILVIFLSMIVIMPNLPVYKNIERRVNIYNKAEANKKYNEKAKEEGKKLKPVKIKEGDTAATIIVFSSRDRLYLRTKTIYDKQSIGEKLFGIGFSNRTSINDKNILKLVEMDFFDIWFHCGIVLLVIYLIIIVPLLFKFLIYLLKNRLILSLEEYVFGYSIVLCIAIATVAGHVFSSPAVSIYLAFLIFMFLNDINERKSIKELKDDKVSFLLLHLGSGGIEKSTVTTANALCDKYEVELVVLYDLKQDDLYKIDPRVKVNYLIETVLPIRMRKYKELLKKHDLKNLFKELNQDYFKGCHLIKFVGDIIKSIYLIIDKNRLVVKMIKRLDSKYQISTRVEFSKLLSLYGAENSIKIAQEHRHHNNDKKYIKTIHDYYTNINYLVLLSESLKNDYETFLPTDTKTQALVIPNMIEKYPKTLAPLKDKTIISISRLHKEKKIDEILDIAKQVKDKSWTFKIIGDGDEYHNLEEKIANEKIKNVELLGALPNDLAIKELRKASIFIMTSLTEGLPMTLLEASSNGVPTVCYLTDSGTEDIVDDKKSGYVIKNRNQKEMVKALDILMNDMKKRKVMGEQAYKKSLEFSSEAVMKKWQKLLGEK